MIEPETPFWLKSKADHNIGDYSKSLATSIIFPNLQIGEYKTILGKRWVWCKQVYFSALRLDDGELLIVISNNSAFTALAFYANW